MAGTRFVGGHLPGDEANGLMDDRMALVPAEGQRCSACKQVKPWDAFCRDRTEALGHARACRTCRRTRHQDWYRRNGERWQARMRQYSKERRLRVLAHYGGRCACCGESQYEFLAIDHINGGGARHCKEIGGAGTVFYRWLEKQGYPDGFRVLCHNCNLARGFYGECPHERK